MGSTRGPPGSCRPQMGPMLAPWILLSGIMCKSLWSFPSSHGYIYHSNKKTYFIRMKKLWHQLYLKWGETRTIWNNLSPRLNSNKLWFGAFHLWATRKKYAKRYTTKYKTFLLMTDNICQSDTLGWYIFKGEAVIYVIGSVPRLNVYSSRNVFLWQKDIYCIIYLSPIWTCCNARTRPSAAVVLT